MTMSKRKTNYNRIIENNNKYKTKSFHSVKNSSDLTNYFNQKSILDEKVISGLFSEEATNTRFNITKDVLKDSDVLKGNKDKNKVIKMFMNGKVNENVLIDKKELKNILKSNLKSSFDKDFEEQYNSLFKDLVSSNIDNFYSKQQLPLINKKLMESVLSGNYEGLTNKEIKYVRSIRNSEQYKKLTKIDKTLSKIKKQYDRELLEQLDRYKDPVDYNQFNKFLEYKNKVYDNKVKITYNMYLNNINSSILVSLPDEFNDLRFIYNAVIDKNTTDFCTKHHKKIYTLKYLKSNPGVIPPITDPYHNCRSVLILEASIKNKARRYNETNNDNNKNKKEFDELTDKLNKITK